MYYKLNFSNPRPLPVSFAVRITGDLYAIEAVGLDDLNEPPPSGKLVIRGEPAAWLYLALTGHNFGLSPQVTNLAAARFARALITGRIIGGYLLARRVLWHWGDFIQPYFGIKLLNAQNRVIEEHPFYRIRLPLDLSPHCEGRPYV